MPQLLRELPPGALHELAPVDEWLKRCQLRAAAADSPAEVGASLLGACGLLDALPKAPSSNRLRASVLCMLNKLLQTGQAPSPGAAAARGGRARRPAGLH